MERPEPVPVPPRSKRDGKSRPAVALLQPRRHQPDHAGMPAFLRGDDDRALLLQAERGHRLGFGLRQASPARWRGARRSGGRARRRCARLRSASSSSSSRTPRSARPMRPPALMRGPSRKPRCQGSGGPDSRATSISAVSAEMLAPPQRDQALGDESAVQALERHHVGDRAERDQMQRREQIGLRPRIVPEIARAQGRGSAPPT